MERGRLASGHSSTYGQACMHCYKAKCRCHRLRKECFPSDSTRRRNAHRAEAPASETRIAQMESRLEIMLSAMQSLASASGSSAEAIRLLNEERMPLSASSGSNGTMANSISTNQSTGGVPTPSTDPSPLAQDSTDLFSPSRYPPSPSEPPSHQAEESLSFFRSQMLPYFPFINLAPDITAWQLQQTRPFLLQAIVAVTTFSTHKRLDRIEDLKRVLFTSALQEVQSNIDLLLGLLTYLAWSTDAFLGRADLISRLMMLAISLVYDMRLFKPMRSDTILMMTMTQGKEYRNDQNPDDETVQGFMEKQRAVLACFVLSSKYAYSISSHLGRIDALRWTPQMEEALRVIETNKSCLTDEAFAFQVRLQLLKQRAAHIREQNETAATASVTTSVPGLIYLKALRGELHGLISSFPMDLLQRRAFITHAHYVELYINQLAYSISRDSPPLNLSGPRSDSGDLPGFERLKCLWGSVESIKSWLDNFYNLAPADLVGLPFHFWSQMILCVTILKYLSVLDDPAWNRQDVRNTVDLLATVDAMIQKLDRVCAEANLQCDDSLFNLLSKLLGKCRVWADVRLDVASQIQGVDGAAASHGACPAENSQSGSSSIPDLDQMMWLQTMDLENDNWFEDALNLPVPFL
ncbi:hypothetical protein V498_09002 [Pseudogymnoascus sp. VKM F-4517 (FW-2822)]|nr:hypothetical protein V498_09002 [Pseudogymnoascus sp. VKM F-4517 (FW-2822)]